MHNCAFTKKVKKKDDNNEKFGLCSPHMTYICYWDADNKLIQKKLRVRVQLYIICTVNLCCIF